MSRKTLLTESEIRKFLKLADLGAVGDAKIQEMYGMPGARDDEDMMGDEEDMDMGDEEDMEMDMGMDAEEEPEMDMDMDAAGDEGAAAGMVSVDDFMSALESALEDVMGEPTSVEMDDEDDMDMDMDAEPEMDMDAEPEMDMDDDEPGMRDMMEEGSEEEIVNEVARRVAKRIVEAKRAHKKMNEALGRKK